MGDEERGQRSFRRASTPRFAAEQGISCGGPLSWISMFRAVGNAVARFWPALIAVWIAAFFALREAAPSAESVVQDGEFSFLPADAPSRRGEDVFRNSFSKDFLGSNVILVVRRESRPEGLLDRDREFIDQVLKPRLEQIARECGGLANDDAPADLPMGMASHDETLSDAVPARPIVSAVRSWSDREVGHLLESEDRKASLVLVNLTTEFFAHENHALLSRIERLIDPIDGELRREKKIEPGLDIALSGSATVGRDLHEAEAESAHKTEFWTFVLVIGILVAIYRSPLLAVIPLVTVFVAVKSAIALLLILAGWGLLKPFSGLDIYITVVMYGSGVDYCVFLISRYKEELDRGATMDEAIAAAVANVGAAVGASAGTTIVGIGMMVFAAFGKFQQAGIALSISLMIVLVASLTFTPSLMMLLGKWAFWPYLRTERVARGVGWFSPTSLVNRMLESDALTGFWDRMGNLLLRRTVPIFLASVAVMAPFAVIAILCYDLLSYGLLSELPDDKPSVVGARAVQDHFSPGIAGPVTVILHNPRLDFSTKEASDLVGELTRRLIDAEGELGLADVRSIAEPLGVTPAARRADERNREEMKSMPAARRITEAGVRRKKVLEHYVSDRGELAKRVTRIDVVFHTDPFSRDSIRQFESFRSSLEGLIPDALREGTRLDFIGATPSIRDLKHVTNRDQVVINVLVLASVYAILVVLVRHPAIAAYLVVSVFFSYLVTLGLTYAVFWGADPEGFAGLDWKVPIFLFTILIACGEDYNIYLFSRIKEESREAGPIVGVTTALARTGGIISSCGLIMAGTFAALMAGDLVGMDQLGFALAFGVLLDTFVVRPILVPAYLILLHTGRFGALGKLLGAQETPGAPPRPETVGAGRER